jgi:hypothetical protein
MEDKTAKELIAQLKRIADALEKSNKQTETSEKRSIILEKLQEKNLRADLREKLNIDPEKVIRTSPRLESEDGSL